MKYKLVNRSDFRRTLWRVVAVALVLASMAVFVAGPAALAKDGGAVTHTTNVVLVHGAWADGSGWNDVIQHLHNAGYEVTAVQLPLSSLEDDVSRVRVALLQQDGPTILVAHSYGGAVITQLGADAPNVVGQIYIAAFAPDEGENLLELTSHATPTPGLGAIYPDSTGYLWLDRDGFVKYFASDVPSPKARVLAAGQKPINSAIFGSTFGPTTWSMLPTWYMIAENDQTIHPNDQHFFAARMGATVSTVSSGHLPMISQSNKVAKLIADVAQQFEN